MEYITKPWQHQKAVIEYCEANDIDYYALFWDMGAGKTKGAVDFMRLKYTKHGRILKTLIITPLVVTEQFKGEIGVHSNIPLNRIQVIDGTTKPCGKKLKNPNLKLKKEQVNNPNKDIFIINHDTVKHLVDRKKVKCPDSGKTKWVNVDNGDELWKMIEEIGIELLIVDEVHRFKNPTAKRTKAIHKLSRCESLKYRLILTGSPVLKDALDLWAQFYILNPTILGENFYSFRDVYFYDANAGMPSHVHFPKWMPKDKRYFDALELNYEDVFVGLNTLIYQHANRVMKDDVLDLPPFMKQKIEVGFSTEQARIYKELKNDLVAFLEAEAFKEMDKSLLDFEDLSALETLPNDEEIVSADLAIVKLLRLQQLVCGIFADDSGGVTVLPTEREKILRELLEELCSNKENKIIVWCSFSPLYELIADMCEELKIGYTLLTGQQSKEEKFANVKAFNEIKEVQVLIANQGAGGTGVNLTASNYSIYYSRSFNLEHDLQSEARNYRGGQTRKVTRIDLVTPDSIDAEVLEALDRKKAVADDILAVKKSTFNRAELLSML